MKNQLRATARRLVELWPDLDFKVYAVWCAAATAYVASLFYSSMLEQTGGEWSAPLDDVFIHFDYARSTARGHPFEWSPGNGYSSGNTSIAYPFALSIGWLIGFRDMDLMKWSALVACASMMVFLTRPESVVCVAAFAIWAALVVRARREDRRFPWGVLIAMSAPGAVAFVGQAVANKVFTGEWAAAGAIAKLTINHPYLTPADKWSEYLRFLRHVVLRNTHRHLGEFGTPGHPIPFGWLVPIMALVPLAVRQVRGVAALLWVQVIGWLLLVSLNGQVVWQNERYTMAAVAWLLVLAAMGLATLASGAWRKAGEPASAERRQLVMGALRIAGALVIAGIYWRGQLPRMRDQIWFFGRASRNIRDQHVVAGMLLARMKAERVLVGDAGALVFASDRPAIDLIGLGGYKDLPFARAGVHGLGSSLELIERLPPEDRPDTMAIYPSWWGDLPLVFGKRLVGVPVFGNVICGGSEKVIYRASWGPLERAARPRLLREGERVVDEVDVPPTNSLNSDVGGTRSG
jgi:hypothetical protein